MTAVRPLRIASAVELVSLVVLLANLATVHLPSVSSLMGPVHGCAWLWVVIAVYRADGSAGAARISALVPGVGGLLALRRLSAP
ncbi:DUF3817 domain-containing protein [Streptomyces sp. NPDC002574]|uniref:DUF3817 domain-containing protein n=1 Tax=Streptomyces sp. NPDC002574 TaxID=3364652 RepID=UPI0036BB4301